MFAEEYVGKKNPAIIVVFAYMHANSNWLKNIFHKSEDIKYFAEEKSYGIKKQGYEMIDKL